MYCLDCLDLHILTWDRVASFSLARPLHTATVVEGKIYVCGGDIRDADDDIVPTDRVDVYDPATDSWQQMATDCQVCALRGRFGRQDLCDRWRSSSG